MLSEISKVRTNQFLHKQKHTDGILVVELLQSPGSMSRKRLIFTNYNMLT